MKKRKVIKIREPGTKRICTCCKQEKDESEFYFNLGRYSPYCNDCKNKYQRDWYTKTKEVITRRS